MNYAHLRQVCEESSKLSVEVLDQFLLPYAAEKNKLDRQMIMQLSAFKHVIKDFEEKWVHMMLAQYIAHRIFKQDGLINKYLHHSAIKSIAHYKRQFLEQHAQRPAQFSFSIITGNPATDFYEMLDVFSEKSYLLFSPGISGILEEQQVSLWFNLFLYNGYCYQSYGPIVPYRSFDADDIFFYATERRPEIESPPELIEDVEQNPLPYMMLLAGANYPPTFNKENRLVHISAAYDLDTFEVTPRLRKFFNIEYASGVYRLTLKGETNELPPTEAYYDENNKVLFLTAMTDPAFKNLAKVLNKLGFSLGAEPDIRVSPSMIITAEKILKKKIKLVAYAHPFDRDRSQAEQAQLETLNRILQLALPDVNAGRKPNVAALAKNVGMDEQTAKDILDQVLSRVDHLKKR